MEHFNGPFNGSPKNQLQVHQTIMMTEATREEQKAAQLQEQYNKHQELISRDEEQLHVVTAQLEEYCVVACTLDAISPDQKESRTCFKMIGGVLVKKPVAHVLELLRLDISRLNVSKTDLSKSLADRRQARNEWMSQNNVKVMKQQV